MNIFFSSAQLMHRDHSEFYTGELLPGFELPSRATFILEQLEASDLGPIIEPAQYGLETALKVHDSAYLDFLATAWDEWQKLGRTGTALPYAWPSQHIKPTVRPSGIDGLLGFHSFDSSTGFVADTWTAAKASHDTALAAADDIRSGAAAGFALCRPPGHHAGPNYTGGYCYLNNAAIAAQRLLDGGAGKVTILDIDYHHGNGTQAIFYERSDVQVINLHCDPAFEYPFFTGGADETGSGEGAGFNFNYPMPPGTSWLTWKKTLDQALEHIRTYDPDALVISLGVDTFEGDPISQFRLKTENYPDIGCAIAELGRPSLFVMEGGYSVEAIGRNVVGTLSGFMKAPQRR